MSYNPPLLESLAVLAVTKATDPESVQTINFAIQAIIESDAARENAEAKCIEAQEHCLKAQDTCLKAQEGERNALVRRAEAVKALVESDAYAVNLADLLRAVRASLVACDFDFAPARRNFIESIDAALAKNPTGINTGTSSSSEGAPANGPASPEPVSASSPIAEPSASTQSVGPTESAIKPGHTYETEVRLNDDGSLDEVCGRRVDAHLEQMDTDHWFLEIGDVAVWLHAKGRRITANYERRIPMSEVHSQGTSQEG